MTTINVRVGARRNTHCVVCGDPTTENRRWCSASCYGEDEGYPDEEDDDG